MAQFNSELEANETRAKFDALSRSSIGPKATKSLLRLIKALVIPGPTSATEILNAGKEVATSFWEDRESWSKEEFHLLVESVVLTVQRLDRGVDRLKERMDIVEQRIEMGLKAAARFPSDGRPETIERIAIVIVRGALDFTEKPQEQTTEFLRISAQLTDAEVEFLKIVYMSQGGLAPPGKIESREMWLYNVQRHWAEMTKMHPSKEEAWMHRKSMCVRLQSYGFLEQVERTMTAEGSEIGQAPYALLPLGKEFCEYTGAISTDGPRG